MLASVLAASLLGLVVIFQFLLALALPFGRAGWGGTHRVLPPRLRLFSALSAFPLGLAAWIVLARASTLAGNLTILGSIANLIVVEGAKRRGYTIGFWEYARVGVPITLATLAFGVWWIA